VDAQLHKRLTDLLGRVSPRPTGCDDAARRLVAMYQDPIRHYHNLAHIQHCLSEFDSVRQHSEHPDALEAAIWFHDAVYDPARTDNEQRSADLARDVLRACDADAAFANEVADLIMVTLHDRPPRSRDGQLLADIDLSGLGQPPAGFDRDGDAIRQEYRHVPDETFNAGRVEMLRRFLDRPHIYYTAVFQNRYEAPARANLRRSLQTLEG
jgi:predicted metal-dependent HD superfamily phosphohydrolase